MADKAASLRCGGLHVHIKGLILAANGAAPPNKGAEPALVHQSLLCMQASQAHCELHHRGQRRQEDRPQQGRHQVGGQRRGAQQPAGRQQGDGEEGLGGLPGPEGQGATASLVLGRQQLPAGLSPAARLRAVQGYGVYKFAKKYGTNVDGYSPIYTPDSWSAGGGKYQLGVKGLIAW